MGNVTTYPVTGLDADTTYYYRVRAYNTYGASGNSNTVSQITALSVPTATFATLPTSSGFVANWNASTGASGYRLDVSEASDFSSFVTGYNNLDVGNVTTYPVTGLDADTTYYYRVRAYNTYGASGNSNNSNVVTHVVDFIGRLIEYLPPYVGKISTGSIQAISEIES